MNEDENLNSLQDKKDIRFFLFAIPILLILTGALLFIFSEKLSKLNEWGDYIGGIVGTIFSLAGVILLFVTLWEQRRVFTRERFESRFFELIKLHRLNVEEFNIGNRVTGRKCFNQMINEFRHIYKLGLVAKRFPEYDDTFINDEDLVDFCYKIFFFGIGYSSERQLKKFIGEKKLFMFKDFIEPKLSEIQDAYLKFRSVNKEDYFEWWRPLSGKKDDWTFEINYYPFDGHSSRLGHYYRHLFQSVKYVVSYSSEYDYADIYADLKVLRAQLSNQEQLLLYYNSLSDFGKKWHELNYFSDYCFIKNLPIDLVEVSPHPHDKIGIMNKYGNKIFEWDEI